jgi:hypothetical protein
VRIDLPYKESIGESNENRGAKENAKRDFIDL